MVVYNVIWAIAIYGSNPLVTPTGWWWPPYMATIMPSWTVQSPTHHCTVYGDGHCVRGSEGLEVVWCCLVVSSDRLSGFVLFAIHSICCRLLLARRSPPDSIRHRSNVWSTMRTTTIWGYVRLRMWTKMIKFCPTRSLCGRSSAETVRTERSKIAISGSYLLANILGSCGARQTNPNTGLPTAALPIKPTNLQWS
jgi:hypothetical protein